MTPVTRKVRVRVPATSANLGSGFDTVGLALDYHDELEFTLSADPVNTAAQVMIEGEGADTLPRDETHLVVSTFRRACQTFGLGRVGFILQAHNNIPQARGMGSSAEAIVAGIAAAAAFAQDDELNRDAVFELAAAIEGHPDNVAPAVYGGLTMSWDMETPEGVGSVPIPGGEPLHKGFHTINYRVADDLTAAVFVPDYELSTEKARQALPGQLAFKDAVHNVSRVSLLPAAMNPAMLAAGQHQNANALLFAATQDRLHQPYRAPLMEPSWALKSYVPMVSHPWFPVPAHACSCCIMATPTNSWSSSLPKSSLPAIGVCCIWASTPRACRWNAYEQLRSADSRLQIQASP